jgi:hypothetical protein
MNVVFTFFLALLVWYLLAKYKSKKSIERAHEEKNNELIVHREVARNVCKQEQEPLKDLAQVHHVREKNRMGLVIIVAQFGIFDHREELWVDVTTPIRFLIEEDSTVFIPQNIHKSLLDGFQDPCPKINQTKMLRVVYRYKGDLKYKMVREHEELSLP